MSTNCTHCGLPINGPAFISTRALIYLHPECVGEFANSQGEINVFLARAVPSFWDDFVSHGIEIRRRKEHERDIERAHRNMEETRKAIELFREQCPNAFADIEETLAILNGEIEP